LQHPHAEAVARAGGRPVILPVLSQVDVVVETLDELDGLMLPGGVDVDPHWYEEDPQPGLGRVEPERDMVELALARQALATGVPLLGICRGAQVLAVAAGGRLYQDLARQLPRALKHVQQAPRWHPTHSVSIAPGSMLGELLGVNSLRVNSFHHQAIRVIPGGFAASAWAPDGVIEAIERQGGDHFVLGVQWHPETMWERHAAALRLFEGLVRAARAGGGAR